MRFPKLLPLLLACLALPLGSCATIGVEEEQSDLGGPDSSTSDLSAHEPDLAQPSDGGDRDVQGPVDQGRQPDEGQEPAPDLGEEGCESVAPDDAPACPRSEGVCAGSLRPCVEGAWQPCDDAVYEAHAPGRYASEEDEGRCDGEDNDCDGLTDEGCPCQAGDRLACGSSEGLCEPGEQRCDAGSWGPCEGETGPAEERCDGEDNDCDGRTDEDLLGSAPACGLQEGVCRGALRSCQGAEGWAECGDAVYSTHSPAWTGEETLIQCDGLDNDCDGHTDEGCECRQGESRVCSFDRGECRQGLEHCTNGRWGVCDGTVARQEVCDGLDNDCDGDTDETCECRPGDSRACGSNVGECRPGRELCDRGRWGPCDGQAPVDETCNGRDDDCDGATDDEAPCPEDHRCEAGSCQQYRWVFEVESGAFGHDVGRRDAEGWSASTGPDGRGYLVFGPYTRDIPAGSFLMRARLMVDNTDADNNQVLRLEVNDFDGRAPDCGDCIIARQGFSRRTFRAPHQYQDLTLPFRSPGGHRLEFRTYWEDIAYVRQDFVEILRAN